MLLLSYSTDDSTRKCDARCYDAGASICKCICGGMNHSIGVEKAIANVQELFGIDRNDLENSGIEVSEMDIISFYVKQERTIPKEFRIEAPDFADFDEED